MNYKHLTIEERCCIHNLVSHIEVLVNVLAGYVLGK